MTLIVSNNPDGVDRQDDLDPDERYWLDLMLKQIRALDLPKGAILPLRARYFHFDVSARQPHFEWLNGTASATMTDLPFPVLPNLSSVQFFIEGAWYCFHHGLWQRESIEGKQRLVISNSLHKSFAGLGGRN